MSTETSTTSTTAATTTGDIEQHEAVTRAEAGVTGWEDAVRLQRWAAADHGDFRALAGQIVTTLHALDDLTRTLSRQVAGYAHGQARRGRVVYNDTREHDPRRRLVTAATDLDILGDRLRSAGRSADDFLQGIGHIGTENVATGGAR